MFAQLGARGVSVLYAAGDDGVGDGDCKDDSGNVRFIPEFPASCTCRVLSPLANTTQAQVQVAHQTAMVTVLQAPMSLASAPLQETTPRSRRKSPEAASRSTSPLPGPCRVQIPRAPRQQVCRPLQVRSLPSSDPTFSYFVICAALRVVASPTSPRKLSNTELSPRTLPFSCAARAALRLCVSPYSFRTGSSTLKFNLVAQ